jgi:hypothetical protein
MQRNAEVGLFTKPSFVIPFFFTIDAAAILLAIHSQAFRFLDTLFPPLTKIMVVKSYSHRFADRLAYGFYLLVFLEFTV